MTDVRSQRLIAGQIPVANGSVSFACPDNHVILVKSVGVWNSGTVASEYWIHLFVPGAAITLFHGTVDPAEPFGAETWVALNPSDGLIIQAASTDVWAWAAGAVLAGPPPFPNLARVAFLPNVAPLPAAARSG